MDVVGPLRSGLSGSPPEGPVPAGLTDSMTNPYPHLSEQGDFMRKLIFIIALIAILISPLLIQAQTNEELKKQIEQLKQQLFALEEKVNASQPATAPVPDVAELTERLDKVEAKTAGNSIKWGGDMRVRFDNVNWKINPYQQFTGTTTAPVAVPFQNLNNSGQYSLRLRLRMSADINENLKFMGRLSMYKLYGGSDVPLFNGLPNTVLNSFNSSRIPSNEVLRVERALLKWDIPNSPFTFSFGRMNSSDGPPLELREGTERQATPQAIMVNAEVDGMHIDYHLDTIGFPEGTNIGVCGGIGYESGFGGGGQVSENFTITPFGLGRINGMKDSRVVGFTYDMPLLFKTGNTVSSSRLLVGYNRFTNMTDIPYGALNNFPVPAPFAFPTTQFVTGTNNLGNMDQLGATWMHTIGDNFTYFVSGGYIKSRPNGKVSQYGFGGLLGDPNHSRTGTAVYTGVKYTPVKAVSLGLEFNHGSPNWFNYTPTAGEPSDKLAARGNVWETYVHWTMVKNLMLKAGYIRYNYSTAFSGWHIAPGPLEFFSLDNPNVVNFFPFPKKVSNIYMMLETRF